MRACSVGRHSTPDRANENETEAVPGRPEKRRKREADTANTFDAIGRAYSANLLGPRGEELMNGARIIAAQYWRIYGFPTPDSLARFQPVQGDGLLDSKREAIIERGAECRAGGGEWAWPRRAPGVQQLVIDISPDSGPAWLDRLIFAHCQGRNISEADINMMRLAREGLEQIA